MVLPYNLTLNIIMKQEGQALSADEPEKKDSSWSVLLNLDWVTLYDYLSVGSQADIKDRVNKFYQSFYPLKYKKIGANKFELKMVSREGLLGLIANYIQKVLFALSIYFQAQYYLNQDQIKQDIRIARMFLQIEAKLIQVCLAMQKKVQLISQMSREYQNKGEQKQRIRDKGFLEIKLICSLCRIFQFFYTLEKLKALLNREGYQKMYSTLKTFTFLTCEKIKDYIKLFRQIGFIMTDILTFFKAQQTKRRPFNFHPHLPNDKAQKDSKNFSEDVNKIIVKIPNKQKIIFVELSEEGFLEYLKSAGIDISRQLVENYFRSQEEINGIIAEEENFIDSIFVSEVYRGNKWKVKVNQQLVNLYIQKRLEKHINPKLLMSQTFKFSNDFPFT